VKFKPICPVPLTNLRANVGIVRSGLSGRLIIAEDLLCAPLP
jgi:hypothetical protein